MVVVIEICTNGSTGVDMRSRPLGYGGHFAIRCSRHGSEISIAYQSLSFEVDPPGQKVENAEVLLAVKRNTVANEVCISHVNFPHVTMHSRIKYRLGGRGMVLGGAWPTLMLRGVSQPTSNAPEVPRAIGMCLNVASGHVRRHFDVSEVPDVQYPPTFAI